MIKTRDLSKRYKNIVALERMNLTVEDREIFGYIGPNGAGKTTTIRILSGLMKPTSGAAEVAGVDVVKYPREAKKVVGYMPDMFGVYRGMRVWEYLDFFGAAYRLSRSTRRDRVTEVMATAGIDEMKDYYVDSLSRGMQQRVGIARALVHDPKVLLLDEPTSGLDPRARIEMRQLLRKLKGMGKTILVSSHILPELATICDRIGIIEQARLLVCDRMEAVLQQVEQRRAIEIEVLREPERAREALETAYPPEILQVQEVVGRLLRVSFIGEDREVGDLLKRLVTAGHEVMWCREVPLDLEHVYMKVTHQAKAGTRRVAD